MKDVSNTEQKSPGKESALSTVYLQGEETCYQPSYGSPEQEHWQGRDESSPLPSRHLTALTECKGSASTASNAEHASGLSGEMGALPWCPSLLNCLQLEHWAFQRVQQAPLKAWCLLLPCTGMMPLKLCIFCPY